MGNYKSTIYILSLFYLLTLKQAIIANADNVSDSNNVHSVLFELEKMASALKSLGNINSKLISDLRYNPIQYILRSKKARDLQKEGYTCTSGIGWHKLYLANLTWNEARKSCRKDEAHLAVINSDTEAKILKNLLLENYQFSSYVGIHNQFKEDEWVTVFGDPLTETGYNRWSVGPPKISEANCGVLFEDGKLLGIPCQVERSYFCEISGMATC